MKCSRCGEDHSRNGRYCRACANAYMRESRKDGKWVGIPKHERYRVVRRGDLVGLEHRFVVQDILGRVLRSDEYVHHLDGDTFNNDPCNLSVVSPCEHYHIHRI